MEKTVKERLISFIKYKGVSQGVFERMCGMSNGYINNMRKSLGVEKLQNMLSVFPDLNREWLLYGEGTMLNLPPTVTQTNYSGNNNYIYGSGNVQDAGAHYSAPGATRCPQCGKTEVVEAEEIPVPAPIVPTQLTTAPDTDVLEAVENADGGLELAPIIAQGMDIKMWHRIKDTAMSPKYEPGDLLAIWPYEQGKERPIPGKPYVINTVSNGMIVRKLFPCAEGYIAKSLTPDEYPEFLIEKEEVVRIFRIIIAARM